MPAATTISESTSCLTFRIAVCSRTSPRARAVLSAGVGALAAKVRSAARNWEGVTCATSGAERKASLSRRRCEKDSSIASVVIEATPRSRISRTVSSEMGGLSTCAKAAIPVRITSAEPSDQEWAKTRKESFDASRTRPVKSLSERPT